MRILIITYPTPSDIKKIIDINQDDFIISVDQAAVYLKEQHIDFDLAVGDFDSLKDLALLKDKKVEKLEPVKDVTDTHYALLKAIEMNPKEIYLIGGMGGERIEHFIAHTFLFKLYPKLVFLNENSKIINLDEGTHETTFKGYISLFAYPKALMSLKGFKYDLDQYELKTYDPLGISNELIKEKGEITIHKGSVLMISSHK